MLSYPIKTLTWLCFSGGMLVFHMALADETIPLEKMSLEQLRAESVKLKKELLRQERQLAAYKKAMDRALQSQQKRIDAMQSQINRQASPSAGKTAQGEPHMQVTPQTQQTISQVQQVHPQVQQTTPRAQQVVTQAQQVQQAVPHTVGPAPDKPKELNQSQIAQIFDQPGVLTPKGQFVFEPSLQYSYYSTNQVSIVGYSMIPALVIGEINVSNVNSSILIGTATGRYGVTNRLEVEADVPYVVRSDSTLTRPLTGTGNNELFGANGHSLGDIQFAARYQLNDGGEEKPYYIGTLRVKTATGIGPFDVNIDPTTNLETTTPTGSGFYTIEPGMTIIYPSDPAVFFGSLNYMWNVKRNIDRTLGGVYYGTVDPGDAVEFNFGMGFALNEKSAFSLGYDHIVVGRDMVNGAVAPLSQVTQLATLLVGYSYRISDKTTINLSLGAGLTQATPGVQLTLRVPMNL